MKIDKNYVERLAVSKSIFDMAAICCQILDEEISNPIAFISGHMDEEPFCLFICSRILAKGSAEIPDICLLTRKKTCDTRHFKVAAITGITGIHLSFPKAIGSTPITKYTEALDDSSLEQPFIPHGLLSGEYRIRKPSPCTYTHERGNLPPIHDAFRSGVGGQCIQDMLGKC